MIHMKELRPPFWKIFSPHGLVPRLCNRAEFPKLKYHFQKWWYRKYNREEVPDNLRVIPSAVEDVYDNTPDPDYWKRQEIGLGFSPTLEANILRRNNRKKK